MATPRKKVPQIKGITSPTKRSADRLIAALEVYSDISSDQRQSWAMEMIRLPTFPYLNMETLSSALVLIYYSQAGNDPIPVDTFNELIDQVIDTMKDPKVQQRERENVLRYIFHIQLFRNRVSKKRMMGIPTNVFKIGMNQAVDLSITEFQEEPPEEIEEGLNPYEVFEVEE